MLIKKSLIVLLVIVHVCLGRLINSRPPQRQSRIEGGRSMIPSAIKTRLSKLNKIGRLVIPFLPSTISLPIPKISLSEMIEMDIHDPELTPGLQEGDIAEIEQINRVGLREDKFPDRIWKNRTVPYSISPLYEPADQVTIHKAIRTINFMTCVKFVPWNGKDKDFLLIWPVKYPKGCWSYVGRTGGVQLVSLEAPDQNGPNCLGNEGRAIHELMHAIGIFHEQSRSDRDRFVKIHWDNIIPAFKSNFVKQSLNDTTYSFEYDYESIMHYGRTYFTKTRGEPTITAKKANVKLGQRRGLSVTDCLKINDLYHCLDDPKRRRKYYTLCRVMGVGS